MIQSQDEWMEPQILELPEGLKPWRGVNMLLDPRRLSDDEVTLSQNVYPTISKIPSKRGALGLQFGIADAASGQIVNVVPTPFASECPYICAVQARGANPLTIIATGQTGVGGYAQLQPLPAQPANKKPCLTIANGNVYAVAGQPFNLHAGIKASPAQNANGIQLATFDFVSSTGTAQAIPSGFYAPQVCAAYNDRMVYANFGPGALSTAMLFSDGLHNAGNMSAGVDPLTVCGANPFAANGRLVYPGASSTPGDRIVGLKEIMLTMIGGTPQRGLLILMENAVWLLTGEPNQSTDVISQAFPATGTMLMQRIAYNCGCASNETIVTTPYGTMWAGPDDIWLFQYGQTPVRIGSKIRPVLQRTPYNLRYRWHAGYLNGTYQLALDSASAPLGDDSACGEQWWLDLRDGAPGGAEEIEAHNDAQWWGPQTINHMANVNTIEQGTRNLFVDPNGNPNPNLCSIDSVLLGGGIGFGLLIYGQQGTRDISWDTATTQTSIVTAGGQACEIVGDFQTKEFGLEDPMADKLVQGLETNMWVDTDCIINADFVMDGGASTDTILKPVAELGQTLDVDPLPLLMSRQTQGIQFFPTSGQRDMGKTFRFRIYDVPGFFIIQGVNDAIAIQVSGMTNPAVCVVAPGYYANALALFNAMITAMFSGLHAQFGFSGNNSTFSGSTFGQMTFKTTNGFLAQAFTLYTAATTGVTAAQARACAKLLLTMGFSFGLGPQFFSSAGVTGGLTWGQTVPVWEMSGMAANILKLPRRPV